MKEFGEAPFAGKLEMDLDPRSWEQKLAKLNPLGRNPTEDDALNRPQATKFLTLGGRRPLVNIQDKTAIH